MFTHFFPSHYYLQCWQASAMFESLNPSKSWWPHLGSPAMQCSLKLFKSAQNQHFQEDSPCWLFFRNFISAVLLSATLPFLELMRQCRPHLSAEQICNNLRKVIYFGFFDITQRYSDIRELLSIQPLHLHRFSLFTLLLARFCWPPKGVDFPLLSFQNLFLSSFCFFIFLQVQSLYL